MPLEASTTGITSIKPLKKLTLSLSHGQVSHRRIARLRNQLKSRVCVFTADVITSQRPANRRPIHGISPGLQTTGCIHPSPMAQFPGLVEALTTPDRGVLTSQPDRQSPRVMTL